jgi:predicted transcriptional regulator
MIPPTSEVAPELNNMIKFINALQRPYVIRMIRIMHEKPQTFTELRDAFGFKDRAQGNKFAHYLRTLKELGIAQQDRNKMYYLTFKGVCAFRLLESIEKICNLSIGTIQDATTKLIVDLEQNKSWLKPLIKFEMRQAIRELKQNV